MKMLAILVLQLSNIFLDNSFLDKVNNVHYSIFLNICNICM